MLIDGEATFLDERSAAADQRRRQLRRWFGRLFGNPLSAIGLVLAALLILLASAAPLLAPQNPLTMDPSNRLAAPSAQHWLRPADGGRGALPPGVFGTQSSVAAPPR